MEVGGAARAYNVKGEVLVDPVARLLELVLQAHDEERVHAVDDRRAHLGSRCGGERGAALSRRKRGSVEQAKAGQR